MMEATLGQLKSRSLSPVVLWTHARAGRAQAFYEKQGFVPTGGQRTGTVFPGAIEVPEVEYSLSVI